MSDLKKFLAAQKEDPEFKDYYDEMLPFSDIAKTIVSTRLERGLTQKDLSKLTGIPQADISRLESCDKKPSLKTLQRIAKALNLRLKIELVSFD